MTQEIKTFREASRFCEKYGLTIAGLDVKDCPFKVAKAIKRAQEEAVKTERNRIHDYLKNKYGDKGRGASRMAASQIAKDLCIDLVLTPVKERGMGGK